MADINPGGGSGESGTSHARDAYRGPAHDTASTSAAHTPATRTPAADLDDEALIGIVELLFFAYRDFTGEADAVLQEFGFGRAHHRVLHFVNRRPGLRVADLLDILRITKQSLARVLKQLVDRGFIAQSAGDTDRRERRLFLTPKGMGLAAKLARLQVAQVGQALASARGAADHAADKTTDKSDSGPSDARRFLYEFLVAMIGPEQRATIASAIASSTPIDPVGADAERSPGSRSRQGAPEFTKVRDKGVT